MGTKTKIIFLQDFR